MARGELYACPRCLTGRALTEGFAGTCAICGLFQPANLGPMPWAIAQTDCWPGTAKVMEECGELVQVLAKLIALGSAGIHWDGSDLRERIVEEVGDLYGALEFFTAHNLTDDQGCAVAARAARKRETFEEWHQDRMTQATPDDPKHAGPSSDAGELP